MKIIMLTEFLTVVISVFALTAVFLRFLIPILKSHKMGQVILGIGPRWHKNKEGTPTMGGIGFIIPLLLVVLVISVVSFIRGTARELIPLALALGLAVANAMIGFFDDYCKLRKKENEGLRAYQKYLLQLVVAAAYLLVMSLTGNLETSLHIPFTEFELDLGVFYYFVAIIVITGVVNSVNLTDGIDGLASSVTCIVGGFFAVVAFYDEFRSLEILSAVIIGATLGFLVYNFYPAKVFMGDTGSLFLGGAVVGAAFMLNEPLVILIAGFVYICEALSDIIQVSVFKLSGRKKRVFRMAPIHHHFEKCGWNELTIVAVFSAVTVLCCIAAWFSF